MRCVFGLLVLLLIPCPLVFAQQSDNDALKYLERIVAHYQNAETVHLEATVTNHVQSDYSDQKNTAILSAYIAQGKRFRYEGADSAGSGMIVSDGTTEWHLLRSMGEYASQPAGTYFASHIALQGDDRSIWDAYELLSGVTTLVNYTRAAHFLPHQSLKLGGKNVRCTLVRIGTQDSTVRSDNDSLQETIIWIDTASLTVLKIEHHRRFRLGYGIHPAPFGRITDTTITTTYNVTELGVELRPSIFEFVPPADSKEVAKLPAPYPESTYANAGTNSTASEGIAATHVGKQLPAIILHGADGKDVPLTKYLGHPILIDVWATWCGPCVGELPMLDRIHKSLATTDLQMIAIDEDAQPDVAADLLKRRGFNWQDYRFTREVTSDLLSTEIPLIVLADASGKIVYYHTGANDISGLALAIAKLGKEYKSVKPN